MLIEASNPLVSVGDEITMCHGEKELVELAELLGLPVAGEGAQGSALGYWSKPFPTRHPLYIGTLVRTMRYPGKPDVLLNLGNRFGEQASPGTKLISIRLDPTSLARGAPVDLADRGGPAACHRRSHRGDQSYGDCVAAQGDRRGTRGDAPAPTRRK